jgi:tRNA (mo5U34)-methyltransferase
VYDVGALGSFDIVVFLGVLYHLKHPLYALEKIESVCKSTLYFQSVVRGSGKDFEPADDYPMSETAVFDKPEYPKLYFVEKSFNGDVSNWWMATRSCLKAMLRVAGFKVIQDTNNTEVFVCKKHERPRMPAR